ADRVSAQQSPERLAEKFKAAGFPVKSTNGNNPAQIKAAFDAFLAIGKDDAPMAVIARTVKGWGAPSVQGGGWHGKPASGDALKRAVAELDERRVELTSSLTNIDAFTIQPPAEAPAF